MENVRNLKPGDRRIITTREPGYEPYDKSRIQYRIISQTMRDLIVTPDVSFAAKEMTIPITSIIDIEKITAL